MIILSAALLGLSRELRSLFELADPKKPVMPRIVFLSISAAVFLFEFWKNRNRKR
jgi:hypothetical protein